MQNKYIWFCLRLDKMQHISLAKFRSIHWFHTKERVYQCINAMIFKFVNKNCPFYLNEIFEFAPHSRIGTINSFAKLKLPSRKTKRGQKTLSYIGLSLRQSCLIKPNNPLCIDLSLTNRQQCFIQIYAIETDISYFNKTVVTVMKIQYKERKRKTIQYRNYKYFHEQSCNFKQNNELQKIDINNAELKEFNKIF